MNGVSLPKTNVSLTLQQIAPKLSPQDLEEISDRFSSDSVDGLRSECLSRRDHNLYWAKNYAKAPGIILVDDNSSPFGELSIGHGTLAATGGAIALSSLLAGSLAGAGALMLIGAPIALASCIAMNRLRTSSRQEAEHYQRLEKALARAEGETANAPGSKSNEISTGP